VNLSTTTHTTSLQRSGLTLALCFCAAIIEGIDLQSMGIAAPGIGPEFHLSKQALGYVLTASPLGLFFGAFCLAFLFAGGAIALALFGALVHLALPILFIVAIVWLVRRASKPAPPAAISHG